MAGYTNKPICRMCQLAELKRRGLFVDDDKSAIALLDCISYFRFVCYLQPFETDEKTHQYQNGTTFDNIIKLYLFDKELRELVFSAIQDIEIALRTRIVQHFSAANGAFWFLSRNNFKDADIHSSTLQKIWQEVSRSKEDFIQDYYDRYDSPILPPAWKTFEVVSFGTLSKVFENFAETGVKKAVAKDFGLPQYRYLESWIRSFTVLRNCSAHHARIWNRRYPWKPQMPANLPAEWISNATAIHPHKLYAQLCCIAYLSQTISSASDFKSRLKSLIAKYGISTRPMGFPANWEEEPLWKARALAPHDDSHNVAK